MSGADDVVREVEAKFRVHPPYVLPPLAEIEGVASVDEPTVAELVAVYVDTSDLRLAREGVTLRRRTGGDDDGWHLKLPAGSRDTGSGPVARDELQVATVGEDVPERLAALVRVWVRHAPLAPVAALRTSRTRHLLRDASGQVLAEVCDDLVSVLDGDRIAGRFREIEVEDRAGGPEVLARVGAALRANGAVAGEFVPKAVRALGPQATAPPDPPPPGRVRAKDPAGAFVAATLRRHVRDFMAQDPRVRRGLDDAVHQMRVSARRLRGALATFRPLVERSWADELRAELAWAATELSAARDAEVLLARLLADLDTLPVELVVGPVRARIEQAVGGDLVRAGRRAAATLDTDRYLTLIDRLVDAALDPRTTDRADRPCAEALPPLVRRAWGRLDRAGEAARRPGAGDADLHQARIAAKRARYATEAVVPVFGRPARQLARLAESTQDVLGEHQDAVVAQAVLRRLATAPRAGTVGFTLGILHARQQRAAEVSRQAFESLWPQVAHPRPRRWLEG